jgi:hypothetical protein
VFVCKFISHLAFGQCIAEDSGDAISVGQSCLPRGRDIFSSHRCGNTTILSGSSEFGEETAGVASRATGATGCKESIWLYNNVDSAVNAWFLCGCRCRVGKLYLPASCSGERVCFLRRHCYHLTYSKGGIATFIGPTCIVRAHR